MRMASVLLAFVGNILALPLHFEANRGQTDARVKFLVRNSSSTLFLTRDKAVLSRRMTHLQMKFVNASPAVTVAGIDALSGRVNYIIGNSSTNWHRNVPTYAKVRYTNIYPGTDLIYYGNQGRLEYDLVLAPGAEPNQIRLAFESPQGVGLRIDAAGDLIVSAAGGEVRFHKPVVYQHAVGQRLLIDGQYVLSGRDEVGFGLTSYDRSKPLVIDPVMTYSTYLGGSDDEGIFGIRRDAEGNVYVAGETSSVNFPTAHPFQSKVAGDYDCFVTKFDRTGSQVIYSTYLGGTLYDHCVGLALDERGSAYVAGLTSSSDFPTANAIQPTLRGQTNAFVSRLDSSGSKLVFSTYLGGSAYDQVGDITLDAKGSVYVVGYTTSTDFPVTPGVYQALCDRGSSSGFCFGDAFVSKLNASGSKLIYSTYLGGGGSDLGLGITVDRAGSAYVTGQTGSANFPVLNPYQAALAGFSNAFLTKLNARGTGLDFSTYLGGNGFDSGTAVALGALDGVYVTGTTSSTNFPTVKPFQPRNMGGISDGFISKFAPSGSKLIYSTYFGGTGEDFPFRVAVDCFGNAIVIGFTASQDFPVINALQPKYAGGNTDAFVTKFDDTGSKLYYSTYLGGTGDEYGYAIHVDLEGNVWIGGSTSSLDFPLVKAFEGTYGGGPFDAFLTKLSMSPF
jgi:hypothetical protein